MSRWRSCPRNLGVFSTAALAAIASIGCAHGGKPPQSAAASQVVVEVGTKKLTRGQVEHWLRIAAIRDYELFPSHRVPAWVVPDPPSFSHCIAHEAATALEANVQSGANRMAQLRSRCESEYDHLRAQALGGLITGEWLIGEGEARGLKVTPTEEVRWSEKRLRNQLGSLARAPRYLEYVGETLADQRLRAKIKLYEMKMEAELAPTHASSLQQKIVVARYFEKLPSRWVSRTSCANGYVVPDCRQYHGASPAEVTLL